MPFGTFDTLSDADAYDVAAYRRIYVGCSSGAISVFQGG